MALAKPHDLMLGLILLTRLPLPEQRDWTRQAAAAWTYPLVGAVLGVIASLAGAAMLWIGLPTAIVAGGSLAVLILLSGAMHEDGLADCADGFWGGLDREHRLAIMKDSQIGSYGVIALILSIGLRWVALSILWAHGPWSAVAAIIAAAAGSRAVMPILMATLPHARDTGLSQSVGKVPERTALLGACAAVLVAAVCLGAGVIWATIWAGLAALAWANIARRKIGGQTGDVLGAAQQLSEIAILMTLIA